MNLPCGEQWSPRSACLPDFENDTCFHRSAGDAPSAYFVSLYSSLK